MKIQVFCFSVLFCLACTSESEEVPTSTSRINALGSGGGGGNGYEASPRPDRDPASAKRPGVRASKSVAAVEAEADDKTTGAFLEALEGVGSGGASIKTSSKRRVRSSRGSTGRDGSLGTLTRKSSPKKEVRRLKRRSAARYGKGLGGLRGAGAGAGRIAPPPKRTAPLQQALPQSGVVASNFVGGSGVTARLDDLLDRGVMVDGEMVRLEAFQDREPLPYSSPSKESMAMFAELERSKLPTGIESVHLQIALLGKRGELPRQPKMDVRLLMDCSGSMRGKKWTDAIEAAHQLVNKLKSTDKFGLIWYSSEAEWALKPKTLGNKKAAHAAIDNLRFGGNTNIGAALELVKEHYPSSAKKTVGQVILISDGRATAGTMNARELGRASREMFNERGVLTTAIGLGTDFDETTMLEIAREGSGSYYFVRRSADIGEILTDELESRAQAVAQGLRVRVELGDGVVAKRIYGSRLLSESEHAAVRETEVATDTRLAKQLGIKRTRKKENEKGLRMHLPTFKRGDQHVILMELEVPAGTNENIAKVTLDYKDLTRGKNGKVVRDVNAKRVSKELASESTQRLVKRTVLAFQAGEAMQNAAGALSSGDPSQALAALKEQRDLLVAASRIWRDNGLQKDAQLLSRYERVLNGAWNNLDSSSQNTLVLAMNYYADKRMR